MTPKEYYQAMWPAAPINGGSLAHVSWWHIWPIPEHTTRAGRQAIIDDNRIAAVWGRIQSKNPSLEMYLPFEDFYALMLADLYQALCNKAQLPLPNRLHNPVTGNKFYRIGARGGMVAGVRWLRPDVDLLTGCLGVRVRFQLLAADDEQERESTRERVQEAKTLLKDLQLAEDIVIPEPPSESEREKVRVHEQGH